MKNIGYLEKQIQDRKKKTGLGDPDGLTKIGQGMNRIAYKITDETYGSDMIGKVIKVGLSDVEENKQEVLAWKNYKNTKWEKYLMPILEYSEGFQWVCMPYGKKVPDDLVDQELVNILEERGATDISENDFVYYEGNSAGQRCCDYASL